MPLGSVKMMTKKYDSLGSNAWVIGGEHTDKGKPLLANDPHLGLFIPSLFYFT
jgi:penicillin amidase